MAYAIFTLVVKCVCTPWVIMKGTRLKWAGGDKNGLERFYPRAGGCKNEGGGGGGGVILGCYTGLNVVNIINPVHIAV